MTAISRWTATTIVPNTRNPVIGAKVIDNAWASQLFIRETRLTVFARLCVVFPEIEEENRGGGELGETVRTWKRKLKVKAVENNNNNTNAH